MDDLATRKVHNWLFLVCTSFALILAFYLGGSEGLMVGILGFLAAIAALLPLVLANIVGSGDMKILAAFGCASNWNAVFSVALLSLVWGAVFGVLRVLLQGQGRLFINNLIAIVTRKPRETFAVHRMPYTIALFFGWLSYLTLGDFL